MRTTKSNTKEFLHRIRLADEGIVIGDVIVLRDGPCGLRLARNGMRDAASTLINIDAQHTAVEAAINALSVYGCLGVITIGQVEEAIVRVEEHPATIVPDGLRHLVDEDRLARRINGAIRVHHEPR